ncbi:hypothetical protein [Legionella septentrionalis]|uniref:Tetratricopeptide repeat protein n=1 Tax=Legionella septentrionalis TaxID=2498109 RepID=A0A3S0X4U3_9GAMM|nr:hypothetical protein [Legionella septentrionalis]RUQ89041.1 hypothetical protein EKM59_04390 [Legionella septentrionalis]RUR00628.1 hypothetical protein ELY11_02430 [Legionella septentrionalis]
MKHENFYKFLENECEETLDFLNTLQAADWQELTPFIEQILKHKPAHAAALALQARILEVNGQKNAAIEQYQQAASLNSRYAHHQLGEFYLKQQNNMLAISHLQKSLELGLDKSRSRLVHVLFCEANKENNLVKKHALRKQAIGYLSGAQFTEYKEKYLQDISSVRDTSKLDSLFLLSQQDMTAFSIYLTRSRAHRHEQYFFNESLFSPPAFNLSYSESEIFQYTEQYYQDLQETGEESQREFLSFLEFMEKEFKLDFQYKRFQLYLLLNDKTKATELYETRQFKEITPAELFELGNLQLSDIDLNISHEKLEQCDFDKACQYWYQSYKTGLKDAGTALVNSLRENAKNNGETIHAKAFQCASENSEEDNKLIDDFVARLIIQFSLGDNALSQILTHHPDTVKTLINNNQFPTEFKNKPHALAIFLKNYFEKMDAEKRMIFYNHNLQQILLYLTNNSFSQPEEVSHFLCKLMPAEQELLLTHLKRRIEEVEILERYHAINIQETLAIFAVLGIIGGTFMGIMGAGIALITCFTFILAVITGYVLVGLGVIGAMTMLALAAAAFVLFLKDLIPGKNLSPEVHAFKDQLSQLNCVQENLTTAIRINKNFGFFPPAAEENAADIEAACPGENLAAHLPA